MLDWFTGVVDVNASELKPDVIYRVDREGNIVWETECWMEAEGSFSDKIRLKRRPINQQLRLWVPDDEADTELGKDFLQLSGNPTKFLQGHNAFGPSVKQLIPMVGAALKGLPSKFMFVPAIQGELPRISGSRVDIAVMVDMGSHEDVHCWLNAMARGSRSRHKGRAVQEDDISSQHGRAMISGDTVYWGKHSRRWTLKAYCKYCEMAQHSIGDLSIENLIRSYVQGQLRIELTLRGQELKENKILDESLVWKYFERLSVGVLEMNRMNEIEALPLGSQALVLKWLNGEDPRMSMNRMTFWRHRKRIQQVLDVDISIPCKEQESLLNHKQFDEQYLREHEVKTIPADLERYLYKPDSETAFSLS